MSGLTVAVLGLGEAGSRLASDLTAAGAEVRGYDPLGGGAPAAAVAGSDVVLSVNSARDAVEAAEGACWRRMRKREALASGGAAQAFAEALGPLGMPVDVVSAHAGDAATLKLLRSVFMKGLAASAIESVRAAEAVGHAEWLKQEIAAVIGRPLLDRLLVGSQAHAVRRVDEMEAARDLLLELGIEPRIAEASAALLGDIAKESI